MSSVDPLAVLAAVTQAAGADVALDLGAIAQVLQAQLELGDILQATVLPPQGGQDLIEIVGQTVVAQLPPDVRPGDTLLLQVTGFSGNQIVVRNLGIEDPQNPVPVFVPELPSAPGSPAAVTLTTTLTTPTPPGATPAAPPSQAQAVIIPPPVNPPVAPPAAVFVAASIKPPSSGLPVQPTVPADEGAHPAGPPLAVPADIEARLVAARAATVERALPPAPQKASGAAPTAKPVVLPPGAAPEALRTSVFARPMSLPRTPPLMRRVSPQTSAPSVAGTMTGGFHAAVRPAQPANPANPARPTASSGLSAALASKDPARILAVLRVPATTVTLAAARLVSTGNVQVQGALQNLAHVLEQTAPGDPRVATVQTVAAFLTRLDPRNVATLTAQISSFVTNVLQGAERKVATLLKALAPREEQSAPVALSGTNLPAHIRTPASAHAPIVVQALAAERQAALTQDLKSVLLSLLANPPMAATAQTTQAVNAALTVLTAMQFNSLIATQQDPGTIALSIPMMFFDGGQSANVRISRDAPKDRSKRMDADNFHIAFVLDTQALGTVSIDLETVGRAVKVGVKTDRAAALDPFNTSLAELAERLEHLRYKVTSSGAEMLGAPQAPVVPDPIPDRAQTSNVDLQA